MALDRFALENALATAKNVARSDYSEVTKELAKVLIALYKHHCLVCDDRELIWNGREEAREEAKQLRKLYGVKS